MRAPQIEKMLKTQTLVAYDSHPNGRLGYAVPVSISGMRFPRKVYSSRGFSSHNVNDGVEIVLGDGTKKIVTSKNITMTWDEYTAAKAQQAVQTANEAFKKAEHRDRIQNAAAELKQLVGLGSFQIEVRSNQYGAQTINLQVSGAEAIVEMLKRLGATL